MRIIKQIVYSDQWLLAPRRKPQTDFRFVYPFSNKAINSEQLRLLCAFDTAQKAENGVLILRYCSGNFLHSMKQCVQVIDTTKRRQLCVNVSV